MVQWEVGIGDWDQGAGARAFGTGSAFALGKCHGEIGRGTGWRVGKARGLVEWRCIAVFFFFFGGGGGGSELKERDRLVWFGGWVVGVEGMVARLSLWGSCVNFGFFTLENLVG